MHSQTWRAVVFIAVSPRIVLIVATLVTTRLYAQDSAPQPAVRDIRTIDIRPLQTAQEAEVSQLSDPPAGRDAWSLRVHTSGGFTGHGVGSVTISSNGQMACRPGCATPLSLASLSRVGTVLTSILEAAWIRRSPGFCSDCIRTTVTLKRREGDAVRMYVATWEDGQSPAPELRELRRLAFELRDARIAQR